MELIIPELEKDKAAATQYMIRDGEELVNVELVSSRKRAKVLKEYDRPIIYDIQHIGIFTDDLGERLFRVDMETREVHEIFDELRQNF